MCEDFRNSDDSANGSEENDESAASDDSSPFGSGDFTDPSLFVDMEALRRRIHEVDMEAEDSNNALSDGDMQTVEIDISGSAEEEEADRLIGEFEAVKNLWIILFSSRDRQEGVYSLSLGGENIVLAFQERSEAQKYATMLEAQEFPSAKVSRLDSDELREFCVREGLRLGFVPRGSLVDPPSESSIADEGRWLIGETKTRGSPSTNGDNDGSTGLSPEEIELMKRRLDNLFGK